MAEPFNRGPTHSASPIPDHGTRRAATRSRGRRSRRYGSARRGRRCAAICSSARRRCLRRNGQPTRIGMEREAADQRLALGAAARLAQHLVELVDQQVGILARRRGMAVHRRQIADRPRIGHRQDAAGARRQPDRLVVGAPVEHIAIAGLLQQVGACARSRTPTAPSSRAGFLPSCRPIVSVTSAISRRSSASASWPWRSALVRPWATTSSPRVRNASTTSGQWS